MDAVVRRMNQRQVVAVIVRLLYDADASAWTIQEKGELTAAVKLQLTERPRQEPPLRQSGRAMGDDEP